MSKEKESFSNGVYPKWLYHKHEAPTLVQSEPEHIAMGDEWGEAPIVDEIEASDAEPKKKKGKTE